jgi:putative membrane protein
MPGLINGFCSGFGGYSRIGVILGWIIVVGLIVGLALLLVALWRRAGAGRSQPPPSSDRSAREVLQIRYARGEITREQYLQMREDLA